MAAMIASAPRKTTLNVSQYKESEQAKKIFLNYTFVPSDCEKPTFTWEGDEQSGYRGKVETKKGDTTYTHTFAYAVPATIKKDLKIVHCKVVSSYQPGNSGIQVKIKGPKAFFSLEPYLIKKEPTKEGPK